MSEKLSGETDRLVRLVLDNQDKEAARKLEIIAKRIGDKSLEYLAQAGQGQTLGWFLFIMFPELELLRERGWVVYLSCGCYGLYKNQPCEMCDLMRLVDLGILLLPGPKPAPPLDLIYSDNSGDSQNVVGS